MYSPADDWSRLKWPGERKFFVGIVKEDRGFIFMTVNERALHGDKSVEFLLKDEVFYYAGDWTVPVLPDSGIDMHQGP